MFYSSWDDMVMHVQHITARDTWYIYEDFLVWIIPSTYSFRVIKSWAYIVLSAKSI